MERINGFIDISKLLKIEEMVSLESTVLLLERRSDVEIIKYDEDHLIFRFIYKGVFYFFKLVDYSDIYDALLYGEVCDELGVAHIEYGLAKLGNAYGLLSRDFTEKRKRYIDGLTLFKEAGYNCSYSALKDRNLIYNNLQDILKALLKRYRNRLNYKAEVRKVFEKIIDMFLIDAIMLHPDRHELNWKIVEDENGTIDLLPIFDNDKLSHRPPCRVALAMGATRTKNVESFGESIKTFFKMFPNYYDPFINVYMRAISRENLEMYFTRIEEKTGVPIPKSYRQKFLNRYLAHYNYLEVILNLPIRCKLFKNNLEEVLKLSERKGELFGESISIGMISPHDSIFATDETGQIDSFESLKKLALKSLYRIGSLDDVYDIKWDLALEEVFQEGEEFVSIETTHMKHQKTMIKINVPMFITPYQASLLKEFSKTPSLQNSIASITCSNYDPRDKKCHKSEEEFTLDTSKGRKLTELVEIALNHLKGNNRIVDYSLDSKDYSPNTIGKNMIIEKR